VTLNGRVLGSATGNGVESEDLRQLALLFLSTYSCVSVSPIILATCIAAAAMQVDPNYMYAAKGDMESKTSSTMSGHVCAALRCCGVRYGHHKASTTMICRSVGDDSINAT
jgi:hypothetical protein